MAFRLNPALAPIPNLNAAFQRDGYVQIADLFEPELAEALAATLENYTQWTMALPDAAGRQETFDSAALAALGPTAVQARVRAAAERASNGFSYVYLSYPMIEAYKTKRDPGLLLHDFVEFVNGPEYLAFARAVVGAPRITRTDAHATLYRPGDFLTMHDDTGVSSDRFAAYTYGLTRRWRPDWGGQLLFHDSRGDITRGFAPRLNVLTLFRVPQLHSVAPVAPYAGAPRLTITGWLRGEAGVVADWAERE